MDVFALPCLLCIWWLDSYCICLYVTQGTLVLIWDPDLVFELTVNWQIVEQICSFNCTKCRTFVPCLFDKLALHLWNFKCLW
jgi:hypothetical protein